MKLTRSAIIAIAIPILAGAQTAPTAPTFDVVSIKTALPLGGRPAFVGMRSDPGRVTWSNLNLRALIGTAYGFPKGGIMGAPNWADTTAYDIAATMPSQASKDQIPLMLQSLLRDRFGLVIHHGTTEIPVYELVVGKNGPKLKPSEADVASAQTSAGHILATKVTMAWLAGVLSSRGRADRVVVDMTGISGTFNLALDWAPDSAQSDAADAGASIYTAVQEQLGLKLEPRKGQVDCVIIDRVEKPSDN